MVYKILRSPAVRRDLDLLFDHLLRSYTSFGETEAEAFAHAQRRIELIRSNMNGLALAPHQGTGDDEIRHGLRHVTRSRAIIYFRVDDEAEVILVVAVFFGGQDHHKRMLKRMKR